MDSLLMRRRAMMEYQNGGSSGTWDYEWNYRDGLLSNNGWTKTISGAASESIDDTGLILRSGASAYVRLSNSNFIMPVGVLEVVCAIPGYSNNGGSQNLRISLSNGINGAQVYENTDFWRVMDSTLAPNTNTPVAPFSANQEYTIRLELNNESFSVFVNDALTYEGSSSSIAYCTTTSLTSQNQGGGASIIKSIKIKRNRLV